MEKFIRLEIKNPDEMLQKLDKAESLISELRNIIKDIDWLYGVKMTIESKKATDIEQPAADD